MGTRPGPTGRAARRRTGADHHAAPSPGREVGSTAGRDPASTERPRSVAQHPATHQQGHTRARPGPRPHRRTSIGTGARQGHTRHTRRATIEPHAVPGTQPLRHRRPTARQPTHRPQQLQVRRTTARHRLPHTPTSPPDLPQPPIPEHPNTDLHQPAGRAHHRHRPQHLTRHTRKRGLPQPRGKPEATAAPSPKGRQGLLRHQRQQPRHLPATQEQRLTPRNHQEHATTPLLLERHRNVIPCRLTGQPEMLSRTHIHYPIVVDTPRLTANSGGRELDRDTGNRSSRGERGRHGPYPTTPPTGNASEHAQHAEIPTEHGKHSYTQ